MSYDYITPEAMYARAQKKPKQGEVYYEKKVAPDTMTAAKLQENINKGRFWISETIGSLCHVYYTQYYYTETGNLKLDNERGYLVLDKAVSKWIVVT